MQRHGQELAERRFFARDTTVVARDLIGAYLVVDGTLRAQIIETEAYLGVTDAASHAGRGPTPRSAIMFGPAGHLYVYLSYGIHHCANIVTEADGTAGAVLLRAAHVVDGVAVHSLCGPGNLCRGLGITLADKGMDLCSDASRVRVERRTNDPPVIAGPRIGISRNIDAPLRFVWDGHPGLSR